MSVQDKLEHILKDIHLLFSGSEPYEGSEERIIVEKQKVFELLEQLNLAVYEMMDQYEVTSQKHELAERRCEKRGKEIIQKARDHADDIYAASIMYTDDAINRICHIMEDANESVQKIFCRVSADMEEQRERIRHNQLELTGQLRDFADTDKYVKMIEEINKQLEKERREQLTGMKEKKIQNEGKSYSSIQPEIKINQEYFERMGMSYGTEQPERRSQMNAAESLARVTGKDFAENLRRRAAREKEARLEVEDMSNLDDLSITGNLSGDVYSAGNMLMEEAFMGENMNMEERFPVAGNMGYTEIDFQTEAFPEEGSNIPNLPPEVQVNLDAEYFKWKEGEEETDTDTHTQEKKERRFLFGRK